MDRDFLALVLLSISIVMQLIAGINALRLIGQTLWRYPWIAISIALTLMAIRRMITFTQYVYFDGRAPDLNSESVALLISFLMLLGISTIGPALKAERKASRATYRALEEAHKAKSDFLANMSHDLRTPLNAIIGFAEIMKHKVFGQLGSKKYEESVDAILKSGAFLLQIINDILDISAIESGKIKVKLEKNDLNKIAMECCVLVKSLAEQKNVKLVTRLEEDIPPIYVDERAMKQIIYNLLANSIKFSEGNGTAILWTKTSTTSHIIEVVDNGIGIPKERLEKVMRPFVRSTDDPTQPNEGSGLGLAIVKSLVELHGGELSLKSDSGKGTVVSITIPFKEVAEGVVEQ